ncbi:hypothetical protein [Arcticibacter eurypsychrophilus]|uniref:hypothetical protein n=1 Tax=Arcticibacter eurypsychrophilus TaxID=1434752 RepID=UPI00084D9C2D|nr:hypothetical protein [Arcticibacter eurypsychrophilus]
MAVIGCQKDEEAPPTNTLVNSIQFNEGRLKITSLQSFNDLMQEGHDHSDDISFVQNKISSTVSSRFISLEMKKNTLTSKIDGFSVSEENGSNATIEDLVPDPIFASVLNEDGEIQIDSTVYKVTLYGTFMFLSDKLSSVDSLIATFDSKNNNHDYSPFTGLTSVQDRFFKIGDGIFLYDTYGYTNGYRPNYLDDEEVLPSNQENYLADFTIDTAEYPTGTDSKVSNASSLSSKNKSNTVKSDEDIYNQLENYSFGPKTLVGKLLSSIRGRDEVHTINFDSKRRVRVNFYDASYIVYSAIGVSVKMEKKNWIGWSGTDASELRIGWDAIQYNAGTGLSLQIPTNVIINSYPYEHPRNLLNRKNYTTTKLETTGKFIESEYRYIFTLEDYQYALSLNK